MPTRTLALLSLLVFGLLALEPVAAQSRSGSSASPLGQGARGMALGRCQDGMLPDEQMQLAVALGAVAPAALNRLLSRGDEAASLIAMCATQVHQQRCAAKFIGVVGDLAFNAYPGNGALPPDPGQKAIGVVGGTAGAVLGVIMGSDRGLGGAVVGGGLGAWGGAKAAQSIAGGSQAAGCGYSQKQLDQVSGRLQGALNNYTVSDLGQLIISNQRAGVLSQAEAQALTGEVVRLATAAPQILGQ